MDVVTWLRGFVPNDPKDRNELMLVVATLLLVIATGLLWRATHALARSATEDARARKTQATVDAWMKIRENLKLPNLRKLPTEKEEDRRKKIKDLGKVMKPHLRKLEAYATVVNSEVFDLETFQKISGRWFVRRFAGIKPYVDLIREGSQKSAYQQLVKLDKDLREKYKPELQNAGIADLVDDEDDEEPVVTELG
jgi:hypothetical protein